LILDLFFLKIYRNNVAPPRYTGLSSEFQPIERDLDAADPAIRVAVGNSNSKQTYRYEMGERTVNPDLDRMRVDAARGRELKKHGCLHCIFKIARKLGF